MTTKGPLPFVISVTGHRDLVVEDIPLVKEMVKAKLTELIEKFPTTPIVLLTGLAEGADRLVAHLALDLSIGIIAVLPMATAEYEKDFESSESIKEFRLLCGKSIRTITLSDAPWMTEGDWKIPGDARNDRYANLGLFLAIHAEDMICLSNNKPNKKTGGTNDVISFKRDGLPAKYLVPPQIELLPGNGNIHNLNVRRISEPEDRRDLFWTKISNKNSDGDIAEKRNLMSVIKNYFSPKISYWEKFNRECVRLMSRETADNSYMKSKEYLLGDEATLDSVVVEQDKKEVVKIFACADSLAGNRQVKVDTCKILFLLVMFMFTAILEAAENLSQHFLIFHAVAILLLLFLICFYALWHAYKLEDEQIDFRVLAEGCRVVFFWKLSGVKKMVGDYFPIDPRNELDWQRRALVAADLICKPAENNLKKDIVIKSWLEGQRNYLNKKCNQFEKKIHLVEKIVVALIFILFVIVLFKSFLFGRIEGIIEEKENTIEGLTDVINIIFLFGLLRLPTIIALIVAYMQITGIKEIFKQYEKAKMVFDSAIDKSKNLNDYEFQNLVTTVGIHSLRENAEWSKIKRDRPLPEHPL